MNTPTEQNSVEPYEDEGQMSDAPDISALTHLNASEINQQIMTAHAYPRSIVNFRNKMRETATMDQEVAKSCLYALKRGSGTDAKVIEGPSARFAEIALQCWGNARAASRIVDIGDEFITAQGYFYDLEKNVAISYEVMRRITTNKGVRYGADMIGVTGNAAASIALRNAILKGIPKAFWNKSYSDARFVSLGKGESISAKRDEMLKAFVPYGIDPAQIYGLLGVKGLDDVTIENLILLAGIHTSIKDGDTTPEEAFSVDHMNAPGTVAPNRPEKSEFTRTPSEADRAAQSARDKAEPEKVAEKVAEKVVETPAETTVAETATDDRKAKLRQQILDFFTDAKTELEVLSKVRDVADLREKVRDQIDPDMHKEWDDLCDKKQKEILSVTKPSRK